LLREHGVRRKQRGMNRMYLSKSILLIFLRTFSCFKTPKKLCGFYSRCTIYFVQFGRAHPVPGSKARKEGVTLFRNRCGTDNMNTPGKSSPAAIVAFFTLDLGKCTHVAQPFEFQSAGFQKGSSAVGGCTLSTLSIVGPQHTSHSDSAGELIFSMRRRMLSRLRLQKEKPISAQKFCLFEHLSINRLS
jgi:hypothetical protein